MTCTFLYCTVMDMKSAATTEPEMTKAQKLDQRMRNDRKAADEVSRQAEARKIVALYDAGELNWPAALVDQIRAVIA